MQDVYAALCNEPWCWPPAVVAKLTDWQVFELILKPAAKRGEKSKGKGKKATRLPTRDEYVRVGRATFGGDPESLGREFDRVMGGGDGGH